MNRIEREWERRIEARVRRGICYMDSPSPPPPDPAIGQAAQGNVELGREALAFQKQQYEEGRPRQAELDKLVNQVVSNMVETQTKSNLASDDYISYMKTTFRPVEQGLVAEAQAYDTPARREEAAGEAAGDVRTQFGLQREMAARDLARSGVDPSSGRYADLQRSVGNAEAATTAAAANQARRGVETTGRALKFDVAGLGRNLPGAGATAAQVGLQAGSNAVNAATVPGSNARADASLVNAGFGSATAGQQAAGNLYLGQYNAGLNAWGAGQQSGSSGMAGIGSLVGLGAATAPYWGPALAAAFAEGGLVRRPKMGGVYADGGEVIDGEATRVPDDGGAVMGPGSKTSDSIPAKVSDGEYVLNADAVELVGVPELEAINQAGLERRAVLDAIAAEDDGTPIQPPVSPDMAMQRMHSIAAGGLAGRRQ